MKTKLFVLLSILTLTGFSQDPIDVTEQTLKVSGISEEFMYYGFAEGDKIIFNFTEVDSKELKEVEVLEYPSSSKFMDYKTVKIENKTISVIKTGVYAFRFHNSALGGRVCKVKIQRIPATDKTKLFNSSIKWVDKPDTTWNVYSKDVIVKYDTTRIPKTKKELARTEQKEDMFLEKTGETVHTSMNSEGNKHSVFIPLPIYPSTELEQKKIVALAYWVGVGEESNKQWEKDKKAITGLAKGAAALISSPLGAYAIGALIELSLPSTGEDVQYGFVDEINKNLFFANSEYKWFGGGNGKAGFQKFTNPEMFTGPWFLTLSNDNTMLAIDVNVKVCTIVETNYYEYKQYVEQKITPISESKTFRDPVITTKKIPVTLN